MNHYIWYDLAVMLTCGFLLGRILGKPRTYSAWREDVVFAVLLVVEIVRDVVLDRPVASLVVDIVLLVIVALTAVFSRLNQVRERREEQEVPADE